MGTSLDMYELDLPFEMRSYLRNNGHHFNKKSVELAIKGMKRTNAATEKKERIEAKSKEQVEEILAKYGVKLEHSIGYDFVYYYHQGYADLFKSSVPDEQHVAMYVKDMIDDPDMPGGNAFRHWMTDCDKKGIPIPWEDML